MKKQTNLVIVVLAVLLVAAITWGLVGSIKTGKALQKVQAIEDALVNAGTLQEVAGEAFEGLEDDVALLAQQYREAVQKVDQLSADLLGVQKKGQDDADHLAVCTEKVQGLENNLAQLTKKKQAVQAQLAEQTAEAKKTASILQEQEAKLAVLAGCPGSLNLVEKKLVTATEVIADKEEQYQELLDNNDDLSEELEIAEAQIVGLEKMVEEKDDALLVNDEELGRIQINTHVLLAKIADLQQHIQELEQENMALTEELYTSTDSDASDIEENSVVEDVEEPEVQK